MNTLQEIIDLFAYNSVVPEFRHPATDLIQRGLRQRPEFVEELADAILTQNNPLISYSLLVCLLQSDVNISDHWKQVIVEGTAKSQDEMVLQASYWAAVDWELENVFMDNAMSEFFDYIEKMFDEVL